MKQALVLLLCLLLCLLLLVSAPAGASPLSGKIAKPTPIPDASQVEANTTWAIYWYLCGSDLESQRSCASNDLEELLSATLSPYVTVVIQTGGASAWRHDGIAADAIGRYVYQGNSFTQVDSLPQANMGDTATLTDFLTYCHTNYPADKEMVIFWDHGGGSCGGVSYDENYDMDYLSISELHEALTSVFPPNADEPPLEIIGFDTCLMSTIDTLAAMHGIARYMVASEETEPGCGWDYFQFTTELALNPDMDSMTLGQRICDSYLTGCKATNADDNATIALIDLSRTPALLAAYEALGAEAMTAANTSADAFFASYGRGAGRTENYGGNSKASGYTDMADLGDLVINSIALFPTSAQPLLAALDECVVYQRYGLYRARARGLSCFYPYSGSTEHLDAYMATAAGTSMPALYNKMLRGDQETLNSISSAEELQDMPLYLDDDWLVHLSVDPRLLESMVSIYNQMYVYDLENDRLIYLGRDTNLEGDWAVGEFVTEFCGTWGAINDHICYMEPVYEGDDYNIYSIPILLNGKRCQLEVIYDYKEACYKVQGAREGTDESVMVGKTRLSIHPGDIITTIIYTNDLDDETGTVYAEEYETFVLDGEIVFDDAFLPDNCYYMPIEFVDYRNRSYITDSPFYEIEGETISIVEFE